MTLRDNVKDVIERLTRCNIERHGGRTVAFIFRWHQAAAWFSQRSQIKSILERYSIGLVIDVGVNAGQFARGVRSYFQRRDLSLEPVSHIFKTAVRDVNPVCRASNLAAAR